MITLYGLKNCDTCRKARRALASHNVDIHFVDLRAEGIDDQQLDRFLHEAGWQRLLNKQSTTWRSLDDSDKQNIDEAKARQLLRNHPTLIKRPLLDSGESLVVGFDADRYDALAEAAKTSH
ncbi:ArsC family reductase [Phytohalomonas tamaricis]|uniref:ArsC family reductase n=1 Tax=Phytohalomonas tamaricis TaxID=2081032 RepID=UPI000D0B3611|nr:ArsC family reductase [Phytohalomonas tamaricis]